MPIFQSEKLRLTQWEYLPSTLSLDSGTEQD